MFFLFHVAINNNPIQISVYIITRKKIYINYVDNFPNTNEKLVTTFSKLQQHNIPT